MNGPFGNGYPYVNFHELNMDWVIKVVKDFLEQYNHIQEIITSGEEELTNTAVELTGELTTTAGELSGDLTTKANELQSLLQEWYNTHSQDIAIELARAIADFNESAEEKAEETIESIPDDYTELSNTVTSQGEEIDDLIEELNNGYYPGTIPIESLAFTRIAGNIYRSDDPNATSGYINSDGTISSNPTYKTTGFARVKEGEKYFLYGIVEAGIRQARFLLTYDENRTPIRYLSYIPTITIEQNEVYMRVSGLADSVVGASLSPLRPSDHFAVIPQEWIEQPAKDSPIKNKIQVDIPSDFKWNTNPLKNSIYQNYFGEVFVNKDVSEYKNSEGTVCYVSPEGDNTGSGSIAEPVQTIGEAYSRGADTIMLRGGFYVGTRSQVTINRDVNIVAYPDELPIITSHSGTIFQRLEGYLSTYYANRGTISIVIDMRFKNKYGYWTLYQKVNSIAEVESNEGTYAHINGVMYIHCINGSDPNVLQEDSRTDRLILGSSIVPIRINGSCSVYLEGFTCVAGDNAVFAERPTGDAGDMNLYAKNCTFIGSKSSSYDCVQLKGTTFSYLQNCEALYSQKDGFNYHSYNGVVPNAIEVNCKGRFNGTDINAANQGSTIHDGGSIIRIGGIYTNNHGSNLADEGTDTHSLNIGCVTIESEARYLSQKMGYYAYNDVYMWIDTCVSIGNGYCIGGAGNIFVRNPKFNGDMAPEETTYTLY